MVVCSGIVSIWSTPRRYRLRPSADLDVRYPGRLFSVLGPATRQSSRTTAARTARWWHTSMPSMVLPGHPGRARERRVSLRSGHGCCVFRPIEPRVPTPTSYRLNTRRELVRFWEPDALLAPEVSVVLEKDASAARQASAGVHGWVPLTAELRQQSPFVGLRG